MKRSKYWKQEEAEIRQKMRDEKSAKEQLTIIARRPGKSLRESNRLQAQIDS